ncbi:MAG: hypothetical protein ED559_02015 [Phycisphaera sp.]|nr:MAG: hypothetical protein ED559_02015 [Phycisphaera sp.]
MTPAVRLDLPFCERELQTSALDTPNRRSRLDHNVVTFALVRADLLFEPDDALTYAEFFFDTVKRQPERDARRVRQLVGIEIKPALINRWVGGQPNPAVDVQIGQQRVA